MFDVSTNAAENKNRCMYHILLTIRSVETRLFGISHHKIAVRDCVAQKVHLERAVNCVPQVVHFILSRANVLFIAWEAFVRQEFRPL
jgi:hypothetical protein